MICRTPEEAFAAGYADGQADPPLTEEQVIRIVHLLGRDIVPGGAGASA